MQKSTSGFTIIELIIVIIVIGIITAIVIIAYGGIQRETLNNERLTELRGWHATFEKYKAANGQYPTVAVTSVNYCLGTGFPNATCSNSSGGTEANAASLMNDLAPYDPPAAGPRTPSYAYGAIGPYALYTNGYIYLTTVIDGEGASLNELNCPDDMKNNGGASSNNRLSRVCTIQLRR